MAERAFLQPKTMDMPVQGDWEFRPVIIFLEDPTMAGLQVQVDDATVVWSQEITDLYLLEEIEYQVSVLQPMIGGNPPVLLYSCMLHVSHAHRI